MLIEDLVSVVVPVYNVKEYIDRCVLSIVKQTYKNLEILLIDDGSTDGSDILCQEWQRKDARIRVIRKENGGLGAARNCGIYNAKGVYLAFIDADDWWEFNAVQKLAECAKINNADLVYMDFFWDEKQEDNTYKQRRYCQKSIFSGVSNAKEHPELVFSGDARTWSKFYKTSLFKDNRIMFPNHPFEDFPINPLLVLLANKICQVHEPLYHYDFKRAGNITSKSESYSFFPCGLEELKDSLVDFGYWNDYKDLYIKYAIELCRSVANGKDISSKDRKMLMEYLHRICPDEMQKYRYKYGYVGSFAGEQILIKNVFHEEIIANEITDIPEDNAKKEFDYERIDIKRLDECDYVFVDLLDLKDAINKQIKKIAERLECYPKKNNIIILELYLSEKHGGNSDDTRFFDDIDGIRRKNRELKKAYNELEKELPCSKRIKIDVDNLYTYEHTNYGCLPQFYNSRYYEQAFAIIYHSLMRGEMHGNE